MEQRARAPRGVPGSAPGAREETREAAAAGALKSHRSILEAEIALAREELQRPARGLLTSGLIAGFGVGASLLLLGVLAGEPDAMPAPLFGFMLGSAYAAGFIIVILGRTDLFTEYTTLAILPVLTGRSGPGELVRLWALVFAGNIAGAAVVALLVAWLAQELGTASPAVFVTLAEDILDVRSGVMFASAALAGWLMGLLSWLIAAARETISQIIFIWIIALVIGMGHLHHSIVGSAEIVAALPLTTAITYADLGRFVIWTTTGNALGGVLFAVLIRLGMVVHREARGSRRSRPGDDRNAERDPQGRAGTA